MERLQRLNHKDLVKENRDRGQSTMALRFWAWTTGPMMVPLMELGNPRESEVVRKEQVSGA